MGRLGTDVGTDKTCKIPNVYRPWDGGTDKLGGEKGIALNPKLEIRNQKAVPNANLNSRTVYRAFPLHPQLSIQVAELDGFGHVLAGEVFASGKVGDGAGDFQDAVVGAGA